MVNYIVNPKTQRLIKVDGPTWNKLPLQTKKKATVIRLPKRTEPWSQQTPMHLKQREKMHSQCGGGCFLLPNAKPRPLYPVCTRGGNCKVKCQGLMAAARRAQLVKNVQLKRGNLKEARKHEAVARKAIRLLERQCKA